MNSDDALHHPHPIQQKPTSSFKSPLTLLAAVFFMAVVAGTGGYLLRISNNQPVPRSQLSPLSQPTIITQISATPGSNRLGPAQIDLGTKIKYTSPFLGISFTYFPDQHGEKFIVQEKGNEICLSPKNSHQCWGTLKIFKKKPSQSLKEAITEQFLTSYDTKKCYVDDYLTSDDDIEATGNNLNNLKYARILYSPPVGGGDAEHETLPAYAFKYCPPEVEVHYRRYFIADESFAPDKFAYDDSGGYPPVDFLDLQFLPSSVK